MKWFLLLAAVAAQPAFAVPVSWHAALHDRSLQVLARTPEADGIFQVQADGSVRHLQSGLVCPAEFPNAQLYNVMVLPSPYGAGTAAGCDYRRSDGRGVTVAKFVLFVSKTPPGSSLQEAFEAFDDTVLRTNAHAQPIGTAVPMASAPHTEFRAQQYLLDWDAVPYTSNLIVALAGDWVIESRATFVGLPIRCG